MIRTKLYTEAEIFEAVCWAIGDDGNTATRTIKVLNSNRKAYGKVDNNEYAKCRQDFNKVITEIDTYEKKSVSYRYGYPKNLEERNAEKFNFEEDNNGKK